MLMLPFGLVLKGKATRMARSLLSKKYIRGAGIEIGAFASPTLVPWGASVRYVDRIPASQFREAPEYRGLKIVEPDIIDDGASLSAIPDASVDFVMCFHMLEHVPDAMSAVFNWIRVLRPGGILLVGVPDKRFTQDANRELTPLQHFIRDYEEGPRISAEAHYRDVATNVENLPPEEVDAFVARAQPAIHFHTWNLVSFFNFWHQAIEYFGEPLELLEGLRNREEVIVALRRTNTALNPGRPGG